MWFCCKKVAIICDVKLVNCKQHFKAKYLLIKFYFYYQSREKIDCAILPLKDFYVKNVIFKINFYLVLYKTNNFTPLKIYNYANKNG